VALCPTRIISNSFEPFKAGNMMEADPFDSLLTLEDQFYEEGFQEGQADGMRQSRREARVFGIEKGFEKFVELGKLQARARIWAARLPQISERGVLAPIGVADVTEDTSASEGSNGSRIAIALPPLPDNARLRQHIEILVALVDPATISTKNNDDAVADVDDRLKRAHAKMKVIERLTGEDGPHGDVEQVAKPVTPSKVAGSSSMEDFGFK